MALGAVRQDNERSIAGDSDLVSRVMVLVVLAPICLVVPGLGSGRVQLAIFLAFIALPLQLLGYFWLRRRGHKEIQPITNLGDLFIAVAAVYIEPSVFGAALIAQLFSTTIAINFHRLRFAIASYVMILAGMGSAMFLLDVGTRTPAMFVATMVLLPPMAFNTNRMRQAEQRSAGQMESLVNSLPILLWEADRSTGHMTSFIGQPGRVLGASVAQLLGQGYTERVHPDDRTEFVNRFTSGSNRTLTYRLERPDGAYRWISDRLQDVRVGSKELVRGVSYDVTSERQAHSSMIRQSEIVERMSAATIVLHHPERLGEAIVDQISDPDGDLTDGSRPAVGISLKRAFPELACQRWVTDALAEIERVKSIDLGPHSIVSASRGDIVVEIEVFALPDGSAAMIVENVTDREKASAVIRHQATHDSLTDLPNRNALLRLMNERSNGDTQFALALLDLNRFKNINDTLGHFTGDELLRIIANRLESAVGEGDMVARLGGDEFAVVLSDIDGPSLQTRLDAVVVACREKASIAGAVVATGASIGVAVFPEHGNDPESLLRFADIAMYEAKRASNAIRFYEPGRTQVPEHLDLMADLGAAFAEQQLEPYFQPKLQLSDNSIAGAEVLARWNHPERGLVMPGDFIDLILLAGQADELLTDMLVTSLLTLRQLPEECHLALNLSAVNLRWAGLPNFIDSSLRESGIDPSRLIVELTESELIDESGILHNTLHSLAEIGMGVSVDDFGTGYSSLSHLRSLPLTELKIDQRFVFGMMTNRHDHVIVKTLIDLGHNLGLAVTAEGVAEEATRLALTELGCDKAQGYLLGRPMPSERFLDLFDPARLNS